MSFHHTCVLALSLGLLLAGCKPAGQGAADAAKPVTAAPSSSTAPAAAASVSATQAAAENAPIPEFPSLVVKTFNGGEFDLAKQRGRWVVVNYWATWCNPCLKEIPDLDALDQARDDIVVIGLAYEEIEKADLQAFLKQHPISYPIAVVDVYSPPADFGTPVGLPMSFLISPDGKVATRHLGPVTSAQLEKEIASASSSNPGV